MPQKKTLRHPFSGSSPDAYYAMPRPEMKELQGMTRAAGALVLLQGPRRIGKTCLVRKAVPADRLIEANLYGAKNYEHCESIIAKAIEEYTGRAMSSERTNTVSGSLFGFGGGTQSKKIQTGDLLSRSFDSLLKKAETEDTGVLFIDEIQTLLEISDGEAFAKRLRTELQRSLHCLSGVFAGSNSSILSGLHADNSSPFYKQLESLHLNPIPREKFYQWVEKRLNSRDLSIEQSTFTDLAIFCRDICGDVQRVLESACYRVEPGTKIGDRDIKSTIDRIVANVRNDINPIVSSLTAHQITLYTFLSLKDRYMLETTLSGRQARELMGGMSSGTIQRSLEALVRMELVAHWNGKVFPLNPFVEQTLLQIQPERTSSMAENIAALAQKTSRKKT